jgi:hypothetical protein
MFRKNSVSQEDKIRRGLSGKRCEEEGFNLPKIVSNARFLLDFWGSDTRDLVN